MDREVLNAAADGMARNRPVALVTVTRASGSTPRSKGAMMCVGHDGTVCGTIGGGILEAAAIQKALECMKNGESLEVTFRLTGEPGSLHAECGGEATVFVNVTGMRDKLVVFGGGHVSLCVHALAKKLGFYTVVVDEREEFCNRRRFPDADELVADDVKDGLRPGLVDGRSYVVIVTRGHENDEAALRRVIGSDARYVGMIGSRRKVAHVLEALRKSGAPETALEKVYAPIGLDLGGDSPEEIALSILAEIQLIRRGGRPAHMKTVREA